MNVVLEIFFGITTIIEHEYISSSCFFLSFFLFRWKRDYMISVLKGFQFQLIEILYYVLVDDLVKTCENFLHNCLRQAWEAHVDLHHTRLLAFTDAEHRLLQSEYIDYGMENRRILTCFRSAVIIVS